jgi:hypothetical protein
MDINSRLTPINHSTGRFGEHIKYLVFHTESGYEGGTAAWFANPASGVSSNYGVSLDGRIDQFVVDGDTAYANGNWISNKQSISIETEDNNDPNGVTRPDAQYAALAQLAAAKSRAYGIPVDRTHFIGHNEIPPYSHPNCPGNLDLDRIVAQTLAVQNANISLVVAHAPHHEQFSPAILDERVTVTMQNLQVRVGPGTNFAGNAANTPDGLVHAGDTIHIIGYVVGEEVNYGFAHTNIWLQTLNGLGESHYIWAGGTNFVLPATPAAPVDVPVTAPPEIIVEAPLVTVTPDPTPIQPVAIGPKVTEINPKTSATIKQGAIVTNLITGAPIAQVGSDEIVSIYGITTLDGTPYLVTQKMHDEGLAHGIATSNFRNAVDAITKAPSAPVIPTVATSPPTLSVRWHRWIDKLLHFHF